MIQIKLKRSPIATTPNQRDNLRGLGLFRREQVVVRPDTSAIRGMIRKVLHLVEVAKAVESKGTKKGTSPSVEVIPPKEPAAPKTKRAQKPRAKKEKGS